VRPNDKRQPREAAAADAQMQAERNGCLPLAARSGWARFSSRWVLRWLEDRWWRRPRPLGGSQEMAVHEIGRTEKAMCRRLQRRRDATVVWRLEPLPT
jgi:hypothetical protein